jgi:hypothetical protein
MYMVDTDNRLRRIGGFMKAESRSAGEEPLATYWTRKFKIMIAELSIGAYPGPLECGHTWTSYDFKIKGKVVPVLN